MPLSSNIHAYADVAEVLAAALPSGRATYRLTTDGQAVHWMQRANKYRLLLQRAEAARGPKGYQPATPYDRMKLSRKGSAVEIDFAPAPAGELSLPDGKVVKPERLEDRTTAPPAFVPKTVAPSDDLMDLAAQLAEEFGGED